MLSIKMQEALNLQTGEEDYASHLYLSMASWCDKEGLRGSAAFLYHHSSTERDHMMKIFTYVNEAGGHALVHSVKEPPRKFKNILDIMELVQSHEVLVSRAINHLVETCLQEKDYSTFNFLQWYVAEQHEEERLFTNILNMIKIAGLDGRGLFLVDKEIGKLAVAK